jgi:S1-C subfamily serine protease
MATSMTKTLTGGVAASMTAFALAAIFAPVVAPVAHAQTPRPDSAAAGESLAAPAAIAAGRAAHQLPEGYLGISFVCDLRRQYGPEGLTIYHYGYPAVESVERGSPADRAGIVPGDTIVAYDSRDVLYRRIVLSRLLRPGSVLAVRVRRNGTVKNLRVSIAPRPATFVDMNVAGYGGTPQAQSGGSASLDPHQWLVIPSPAFPPLPPLNPAAAQRAGIALDESPAPFDDAANAGDETATIAGAQLVRTNADLREALALDSGILVVAVGQGTPAAQAGLRAGDVVVSAHGDPIGTPQALAGVLRQAKRDDQPLSLQVVRRHQTRTVVLR